MHPAASALIHRVRLLLCHGAVLLLLGLAACASPGPAESQAKKSFLAANVKPPSTASISADDITQGAMLHTAKCARCHKLYDPAAYPDADWRLWMTKMSKKAKLTHDQEAVLSRYLEAFRAPRL